MPSCHAQSGSDVSSAISPNRVMAHAPSGMRRTRAVLAGVPFVLLLAGAAIEALRPPMLVLLLLGFLASLWRARIGTAAHASERFAYAAALLVVLGMAWSGVELPASARDGSTCADLLAPFAMYRAAGAVLVLASVALTVWLLGSTAAEIGLRRVSRRELGLAAGALGAVGFAATFIGPAVAEPFFGPLPVALGDLAAVAPALVFAMANALMEETVFRGALLHWLMRWRGPFLAMAVQAAAFGLAHGVGGDFAGSPLPVMAATAAAGLALGAITLRTGSLLLPVALHAALDIPIYYANACLQN